MQSYGEILKKTREEKKISLETAANDTSITVRYLQALENEDVDIFPGEPYLIGFLHNYSEYLGLNPDTLVSLYKKKKIQEAPIPAELIEKRRPRFLIFAIVIGIAAIGAAVFFIAKTFVRTKKTTVSTEHVAVSENMNTHTYTLSDKPLEVRVYKGDHIIVPIHGNKVILTVAGTVSSLSLDTPMGIQIIDLSEELELDVDGDAVKDAIVYVSDVSTPEVERGAEVRMLLATAETKTSSAEIPPYMKIAESKNQRSILQDDRAYPFTLNVSFRGSCVYRYRVDNNNSVEDYYTGGEIVTVTADNGIRIWISDGSAAKLQIVAGGKSFDLDVGKAGRVLVEDIRWVRDADGVYKIVVIPVD